jgi:hypothetical protein
MDDKEYLNLKNYMENKKNKIDEIFKRYSNKRSASLNEEFQFEDWNEFYAWYKEQTISGDLCCYCGVNQNDINNLNKTTNPMKRLQRKTRGNSLEIERVESFIYQNEIANNENNIYSAKNCRLACHVCNNAKSDFLTVTEFKPIAFGINQFWRLTLDKEINMPTEVYETFK